MSHQRVTRDFPTGYPAMQSVYDGRTCIGFLLGRGRAGVEAFTVDERSLGIFPSTKVAAAAVSRAAQHLLDQWGRP